MFKTIINACVLILLFKITIAQIHLTKDNLNQVCKCETSFSDDMILTYNNIFGNSSINI